MVLIFDYPTEIKSASALTNAIRQVVPTAAATWGAEGKVFVDYAQESDRLAIQAILDTYNPSLLTSLENEQKRRDTDMANKYLVLQDSPRVYKILEGAVPKPMTTDDIEILAELVRYIFNELNIPMPDWTLNARSD